jgi:phage baseplate assembly protein W
MALYGSNISTEIKDASIQKIQQKYYGCGFPTGKNSKNIFNKEYGSELVKSQVKQLLLVDKGERVMLPNYGIGLRSYLFSNITPEDVSVIRTDIKDAIVKYIPNCDVLDIDVVLAQNYKYGGMDGLLIKLKLKHLQLNQILDFNVEL